MAWYGFEGSDRLSSARGLQSIWIAIATPLLALRKLNTSANLFVENMVRKPYKRSSSTRWNRMFSLQDHTGY